MDADQPAALAAGAVGERGTFPLTGVPDTPGDFDLLVRVTDEDGERQERTFTVTIAPAELRIVTTTLPQVVVGRRFEIAISATGGSQANYQWALGGNAPSGLSIEANRTPTTQLSGALDQSGQYDFTVSVTDSLGATAEQAFTLTSSSGAIRVIPDELPVLQLNVAATGVWLIEGGDGDFQWTATASAGLGLQSDASGTGREVRLDFLPTRSGPGQLVLQIEDGAGQQLTERIDFDVPTGNLRITTSTVPNGRTCHGYGIRLEAVGSAFGTYTWSVSQGSLPPGVELKQDDDGAFLQGVLTQAGTFSFTVEVRDPDERVIEAAYEVTVDDAGLEGRYVALAGRFDQADDEVRVVDVCATTPVSELVVSPQNQANAVAGPLAFSPNGLRLAFSGSFAGPDVGDVFVAPLDGNTVGVRRLAAGAGRTVRRIDWSPNSDRLTVLLDNTADGTQSLTLVPADTGSPIGFDGAVHRRSAPIPDPTAPVVAWSPSGAYVAWLEDAVSGPALTVATADGATTRTVSAPNQAAEQFAWRDGENLIFSQWDGPEQWNLYAIDLSRDDPALRIADTRAEASLALRVEPGGEAVAFFGGRNGYVRWSNDSPRAALPLLTLLDFEADDFAWSPAGGLGVILRRGAASLVAIRPNGRPAPAVPIALPDDAQAAARRLHPRRTVRADHRRCGRRHAAVANRCGRAERAGNHQSPTRRGHERCLGRSPFAGWASGCISG